MLSCGFFLFFKSLAEKRERASVFLFGAFGQIVPT